MNILQVVPELNAGGVERTTIEIAQALHARGFTAHVASEGGRMEDELRAAQGALHRLPMGSKNPLNLRSNTKALIDLIKKNKIDLVHARSRAPAWAAKAAAQATGVAFITTYHGIYNAKSGLKRRYNAVMTKGDIIIANSKFTKAHIIKEHNISADKIIVIARGVDMVVFDPKLVKAKAVKDCKKNWGIENTSWPVLLLPGRLTRWKGQLVAIKSLAELKENGVDAYLVLLGDAQGRDDYITEIEVLSESLGISDRVKIVSHTLDMPTAYMAANLVISASTDPEAFGRVAVEAQAMQKLVIATKHGGALETVIEGETGFLVTPSDVQALTTGISEALALSPAKYKTLGGFARKRIMKEFSAQALKEATLAVYQQAIATNKSP
ncbi:MAG: glycosyl transferase [Robiginitomaculum sp.]|nr:MAG: glycosyl transferase [Robiginitomaculum sp.]